jgi:lipocalin
MIVYLLLATFICSVFSTPTAVSELNVALYMDHWYQVYGAPTNAIFQGYGTCVTADYGLLSNGQISVLNTQLNKNKEIEKISGYGYYKNASEPGKLTVHLDGVPVDSPYWVVKLGEIVDDQYQYSIVSVPSGISLWVLTRNVKKFNEEYDAEVRDFLDTHEFNYVPIIQTDCEPKLYLNHI